MFSFSGSLTLISTNAFTPLFALLDCSIWLLANCIGLICKTWIIMWEAKTMWKIMNFEKLMVTLFFPLFIAVPCSWIFHGTYCLILYLIKLFYFNFWLSISAAEWKFSGKKTLVCLHFCWFHYLDCFLFLPHGLVGNLGWWNIGYSFWDYGFNLSCCWYVDPWFGYLSVGGEKRLRRHGCI